jgi:hypothetical protein
MRPSGVGSSRRRAGRRSRSRQVSSTRPDRGRRRSCRSATRPRQAPDRPQAKKPSGSPAKGRLTDTGSSPPTAERDGWISAIASRHAGEIERVLIAALRNGSPSQRLKSAELLIRFWLQADAREVAEEVPPQTASRAELIFPSGRSALAPGLASALLRDELARRQVNDAIVDGSATELRALSSNES